MAFIFAIFLTYLLWKDNRAVDRQKSANLSSKMAPLACCATRSGAWRPWTTLVKHGGWKLLNGLKLTICDLFYLKPLFIRWPPLHANQSLKSFQFLLTCQHPCLPCWWRTDIQAGDIGRACLPPWEEQGQVQGGHQEQKTKCNKDIIKTHQSETKEP